MASPSAIIRNSSTLSAVKVRESSGDRKSGTPNAHSSHPASNRAFPHRLHRSVAILSLLPMLASRLAVEPRLHLLPP